METGAPLTDVINADDYLTELNMALARHGLGPENLELVDEVKDPRSPFRVATCYKIEKRILLKRIITREEQDGLIAALKEFDHRAELLREGLTLLKHAVMHEACHILWRYKNCDECDAWAFYEMKF